MQTKWILCPVCGNKTRLQIQTDIRAHRAVLRPFGAAWSGGDCFPDLSDPMPLSAPGTVWGSVWVRPRNFTVQRLNCGT